MARVVALSGFMGSGKSSIGRIVARRLGRRFIDLDEYVEQREGAAIADLFLERGEAGFRKAEAEALADILGTGSGECVVLALGGGTVTWPDSARLLAGRAFVLLISVPAGDLWRRVRNTERPLAQSKEGFFALARTRETAYRSTADSVVEAAGLSRKALADKVVDLICSREAGGNAGCHPSERSA